MNFNELYIIFLKYINNLFIYYVVGEKHFFKLDWKSMSKPERDG